MTNNTGITTYGNKFLYGNNFHGVVSRILLKMAMGAARRANVSLCCVDEVTGLLLYLRVKKPMRYILLSADRCLIGCRSDFLLKSTEYCM